MHHCWSNLRLRSAHWLSYMRLYQAISPSTSRCKKCGWSAALAIFVKYMWPTRFNPGAIWSSSPLRSSTWPTSRSRIWPSAFKTRKICKSDRTKAQPTQSSANRAMLMPPWTLVLSEPVQTASPRNKASNGTWPLGYFPSNKSPRSSYVWTSKWPNPAPTISFPTRPPPYPSKPAWSTFSSLIAPSYPSNKFHNRWIFHRCTPSTSISMRYPLLWPKSA